MPRFFVALALTFVFLAAPAFNPAVVAAQSSASHTVGLRIIVVDSADEAARILELLKQGADFATIAKKESMDPNAGNGGYLGEIDPATLRPELRDGLRGLAPGQISAVIAIPSGYAILQVQSPSNHPSNRSPAVSATEPGSALPLSATGAIRYQPFVGGKGEADLAFRSVPKPDGWNQDLQAMCKIRKDSLATVINQLVEELAHPDADDSAAPKNALDLIETRYALANLYSYQGDMAKAVEQ